MTRTILCVISMSAVLGGCSRCGSSGEGSGGPTPEDQPADRIDGTAAGEHQPTEGKVLLVAQSTVTRDDQGLWVRPDAAKLLIFRHQGGSWSREEIVDSGSNVFHKGMVFGDGAILTIGGDQAALKLWRSSGGEWQAETVWQPSFGGQRNRLRDVEVANFDGGDPEIVLATHDQGVVAVVRRTSAGWEPMELDREPDTFVHEVEVGDVDGDGTPEVYSTPSRPNLGTGGAQPGKIKRYRWTGTGFESDVVAQWDTRHAKEVLVADLDGNGRPELYAALEGETEAGSGPGGRLVEPAEIVRLTRNESGWTAEVVGVIPDERQCRFLMAGDLDGDGRSELIAAAFTTGIWMLEPGASLPWSITNLTRSTGGYEHASLLADMDGDGALELFVADDTHGRLVRFTWQDGRLSAPEVIATRAAPQSAMTWNLWVADLETAR
jgi:hypothetical protein